MMNRAPSCKHRFLGSRRGQSIVEYIMLCAMVAGVLAIMNNFVLPELASFAREKGDAFSECDWRATPKSGGGPGAMKCKELEYHYNAGMGGSDEAVLDVK
jgi:hypothetical protein